MPFARHLDMGAAKQIGQYARGRIIRRLVRSMPWIGGAVAVLTIGTAVRRKGVLGGSVDTALDAMPGVGAVKNAFEALRGRDFIRDKTDSSAKGSAAEAAGRSADVKPY